jgi:hypothetical protein
MKSFCAQTTLFWGPLIRLSSTNYKLETEQRRFQFQYQCIKCLNKNSFTTKLGNKRKESEHKTGPPFEWLVPFNQTEKVKVKQFILEWTACDVIMGILFLILMEKGLRNSSSSVTTDKTRIQVLNVFIASSYLLEPLRQELYSCWFVQATQQQPNPHW